jgi:hypothetical protein
VPGHGRRLRAWHCYCEALELAHRADDPDLVAYALANMSSLRLDAGEGPGSVELAQAALAVPNLGASARRYALRHAAHAYSLTGDRNACDRALGEAAALPDPPPGRSGDRSPWGTSWFTTAAYVDAQRATCLGRLGRTGEAAGLWSSVLDQHPNGACRDRGVYLARFAAALFDVEGPGAALAPALQAVGCHQHAGSARMRDELTRLQNRAAARQDTTAGRDLYEALRSVA